MADVNDIENKGYWGDEFINEEMEQQKRKLETQKAEDDARIEQLSKGRQYWVGANMLANVFAQAVNSWGTANGAPAMQMPEYNNEYLKIWKESDEKRMASYQKMKDYYDRLRLMKVNRDQQLADREAGWQHQQDVIDENRQYEQGKKDEERQRKYDGLKAAYPKWSDNEIYGYIDTDVKPELHVKKEKEEEEQRMIRIYQEQANARANAKAIYSGKGKEDENNIYIASEYGEPIMIPGKDKSSKKANIGLVGALVGEKLAQRFRKVEWYEISKATTDEERGSHTHEGRPRQLHGGEQEH